MKELKSKEEGIKLYFEMILISYLFLILFFLFNGLFDFRLDNKWFYFAYLFEFSFLFLSLLCFILSIKGSLSLSKESNKRALLTNFIVYPTYIVFTFIYNFVYHYFNKGGNDVVGMDINFTYFILNNIFLIYMMMFNFKYKSKFKLDYKKNDINTINELLIGVNLKEYNLKDLNTMRNVFNLVKYSSLFIFTFIGFGILINKIIKNNLALFIWILLNVIWFLILIIIFFIKNTKIKMFNYKFIILSSIYFILFGFYFVFSAYMFTIAYNYTKSQFAFLFTFMLFIVGLFFSSTLKLIYPYYKLFFKLNIKEKEMEENRENNEEIKQL